MVRIVDVLAADPPEAKFAWYASIDSKGITTSRTTSMVSSHASMHGTYPRNPKDRYLKVS